MIVIYYIPTAEGKILFDEAGLRPFADNEFSQAMKYMEEKRRESCRFVIMANEPNDMVGGFGVNSIVDGKLPSGEVYDWSKAGRAGKMRLSDADKTPRDGNKL